jgi:hypothetical protein
VSKYHIDCLALLNGYSAAPFGQETSVLTFPYRDQHGGIGISNMPQNFDGAYEWFFAQPAPSQINQHLGGPTWGTNVGGVGEDPYQGNPAELAVYPQMSAWGRYHSLSCVMSIGTYLNATSRTKVGISLGYLTNGDVTYHPAAVPGNAYVTIAACLNSADPHWELYCYPGNGTAGNLSILRLNGVQSPQPVGVYPIEIRYNPDFGVDAVVCGVVGASMIDLAKIPGRGALGTAGRFGAVTFQNNEATAGTIDALFYRNVYLDTDLVPPLTPPVGGFTDALQMTKEHT